MVHVSAAQIALVQTLNPLLTALLAWPLLGERLPVTAMAGIGAGSSRRRAHRRPRRNAQPARTAWPPADRRRSRWACVPARCISAASAAACRSWRARRCNCWRLPRLAQRRLAMFETPHAEWVGPAIAAIAWNAGAVSLGGMALYYLMLVRGTVARATANFYLVPGTAALMAWALLGERLSALTVAGLIISSIGCWLVSRRERRQNRNGMKAGCAALIRGSRRTERAARPTAGYLTANCVSAEHDLPFGIGHLALALVVRQHRHAALHRRTRGHRIVPALHVRIVVQLDLAPLGIADPGEGDDVRHAVFVAGQPCPPRASRLSSTRCSRATSLV